MMALNSVTNMEHIKQYQYIFLKLSIDHPELCAWYTVALELFFYPPSSRNTCAFARGMGVAFGGWREEQQRKGGGCGLWKMVGDW